MLNEFLIGLQFLTRIRFVSQKEWTAEGFGRSVRYFPLVGAVLGVCLAAAAYLCFVYLPKLGFIVPHHIAAFLPILLGILLTGGLHCDGFMDTMDGIFSGRSREKMLEIMKDSRVGSNGVVAFLLLILCKWSVIMDLNPQVLPIALFIMPIAARLAMVMGITLFPYARPEGMGKAFAQYAGQSALAIAFLCALVLIVPFGFSAIMSMTVIIVFAVLFARYATRVLGGLTGDVYGALTELSELLVLLIFLIEL